MAPVVVLGTVLGGFALPASAAVFGDAPSRAATMNSAAPEVDALVGEPVEITVNAGGVRTGLDTVGPMPDGAVFTATWYDDGGDGGIESGPYSCTIDNGDGTCAITVPAGSNWSIQQTVAPDGYYLSENLDWGSPDVVEPSINAYLTGDGVGGDPVVSDIAIPGTDPNAYYQDWRNWGNRFGGLLNASVENPLVPEDCGLDIALVLDQSGSMNSNGKQAALKEAAAQTVTALTGTPSNVAMYTFNTLADPYGHIDSTSTLTADSAAPLQQYVSGLPDTLELPPLTNWDRGLSQVDGSQFDIVVLLTDGNPTVKAEGQAATFSSVNFANVAAGAFSANQLKQDGARVVAIGIGLDGGADNLRAVSGQTEGSDYYLASDTDFGDVLKELSAGTCDSALTIQKQVQDVDGNLIPNATDSNDWEYTNTISEGTIGETATTAEVNGENGFTSVPVSIEVGQTPTITATETLKPGYSLVGAQCTVNGADVPTDVDNLTASFTAVSNATMTCVFTNRQIPTTTITHTKTVVPGSVEQAADGTWSVQYEIEVENTGSYDGVYSLDDTLRYGTGITPGAASWTASNGLSGSWADPAADAHTVLATDQPLAADATDTYGVAVSGIDVAAGVIDSAAGECPTNPTDSGAFNNGAGLTFNGIETDATDCAAPSKPVLEKDFVSATPDADNPGTWAVTYTLTVDNSKGENDAYYTLMDNSRFAQGVTITEVTIDGVPVVFVDGDVPIIFGDPELIAAGDTKVYTLTFTVTVGDVATDVQACSSAGAGHGYFNAATLTVAHDEQVASDCAPITPKVDPLPPVTPPTLATTGFDMVGPIGLAGLLLAIGATLTFWLRRRLADGSAE